MMISLIFIDLFFCMPILDILNYFVIVSFAPPLAGFVSPKQTILRHMHLLFISVCLRIA